MTRLYETKDEGYNRQLREYYRGEVPSAAPTTFPPRIVRTRPRYQSIEQMARKNLTATVTMLKKVRNATGRSPVGP